MVRELIASVPAAAREDGRRLEMAPLEWRPILHHVCDFGFAWDELASCLQPGSNFRNRAPTSPNTEETLRVGEPYARGLIFWWCRFCNTNPVHPVGEGREV